MKNYMHINSVLQDLISEKKSELFHQRAMLDPRYTSEEHGIPMDDYISDWDSELLDYEERVEHAAIEAMKKCK